MHRKLRVFANDPGHAHELTFSTNGRRPLLMRSGACEFLAAALNRAAIRHEFDVWAYVFMPEPFHLFIHPLREAYDIGGILKAIKSPAAKAMLGLDSFRDLPERVVWLPGGGYDRNIANEKEAQGVIEYLHRNPVRRALCETPDSWPFSSAGDYQGRPGPVTVKPPGRGLIP